MAPSLDPIPLKDACATRSAVWGTHFRIDRVRLRANLPSRLAWEGLGATEPSNARRTDGAEPAGAHFPFRLKHLSP